MNTQPEKDPIISLPNDSEDESPIYRNRMIFEENGGILMKTFRCQPKSFTLYSLLKGSSDLYDNRKCLGERTISSNGFYGKYSWISYREFFSRVLSFSKSLIAIGAKEGDKIGIIGSNSIWWQIACYAITSISAVCIPIPNMIGDNAIKHIINETEINICVVDKEFIQKYIQISTFCTTIKTSILISTDMDLLNGMLNHRIIKIEDMMVIGETTHYMFKDPEPNTTAVIIYTSGSSGLPKGCVLSHGNLIAGAAGYSHIGCSITYDDILVSYLPLSHIYEFIIEIIMIAQGASIGFFTGSAKRLMEDIKVLRPTIICGVPRFWNRITEAIIKEINSYSLFQKSIHNFAIMWKSEALRSYMHTSFLCDYFIFRNFSNALGGRVRLIVSGGAPLMPSVYDILRVTITPNIVQGYGLTEASGCVSLQQLPSTKSSSVGHVSASTEIKLKSVTGLMYNPRGHPVSGEIFVRGPCIFKGYYKDDSLTQGIISKDGWLATGDIGQITDDGCLQIIDRISNHIKLSRGEYISVTNLTEILNGVDGVKNLFIYVDPHHDSPAAVVIPSEKMIALWKSRGITNVTESTSASEEMRSLLNHVLDEHNCRNFEKISAVIINLDSFDNDEPDDAFGKGRMHVLRKQYEYLFADKLR